MSGLGGLSRLKWYFTFGSSHVQVWTFSFSCYGFGCGGCGCGLFGGCGLFVVVACLWLWLVVACLWLWLVVVVGLFGGLNCVVKVFVREAVCFVFLFFSRPFPKNHTYPHYNTPSSSIFTFFVFIFHLHLHLHLHLSWILSSTLMMI